MRSVFCDLIKEEHKSSNSILAIDLPDLGHEPREHGEGRRGLDVEEGPGGRAQVPDLEEPARGPPVLRLRRRMKK